MSKKNIYPIIKNIAWLCSILLIVTSCGFRYKKVELPERSLKEKVYVTRMDNGDYHFQFATTDTLQMFYGTSPSEINWDKSYRTISQGTLTIKNFSFSNRYFFGFQDRQGNRFVASERLIPMEKGQNFRDLGGIPTKDGRVVQWGKLYRSGKLNQLTDRDLAYFNTLAINTVVDFRDDIEVVEDKSRLPKDRAVNQVRTPIGDRSGNMQAQLKKQIRKADQKTFDSEGFVVDVMRQFIDTFAFQYQPFLDLIVEEEKNAPLLYHCSAGKDRTGLGTALVLAMLGVEKEVILGDFMMSNYYRNKKINSTLRKTAWIARQRVTQPLVEVKDSYLKAAFDAIEAKYGSMENFFKEEYGYDKAKLERVREQYLTNYE
ncbi:MAG: tyrosine-protein phosphatase [Bacteroidota bacterium]